MKIYAINGVAKSGKDTFCNMVRVLSSFDNKPVRVISTIDPIKEIYSEHFGWDGDKFKDHHRKNLNTLKMVWKSCSNGPHNWTIKKLDEFNKDNVHSVFIMVREFDEMMDVIDIGMRNFGNGQTIQIIRLGLPMPLVEREFLNSHPYDYEYNWSIHNPTTDTNGFPLLIDAARFFWNSTSTSDKLFRERINFNQHPMRDSGPGKSIRDIIFDHAPV